MYLTTLSQDGETGTLSATDTQATGLSAINGIWNPCAGSVTPWETHLGSDEYPPDATKGVGSASSMASSLRGRSARDRAAGNGDPDVWIFPVELSGGAAGAG